MFNLGMGELVVILLIVLVLFGAAKLPEIARSLGRSIQEFKKAGKEMRDNLEDSTTDDDKKAQA